jgi:hypothetical protein
MFVLASSIAHLSFKLIAEEKRMFSCVTKSVCRFLALACVVSIPLALGAQDSTKPAAKAQAGDSPSRWDIFAGYSFMMPNATVDGFAQGPNFTPIYPPPNGDAVSFLTEKVGSAESVTRFFNDRWGVQIDAGQHDVIVNSPSSSNSGLFTAQGGLVRRWVGDGRWTPFVHVLGGGADLHGPDHQGYTPGWTTTIGGGVDYGLNQHWSIRAVQADYEFVNVRFGAGHMGGPQEGWQPGGTAQLEGIRLSAGVVYHIGTIAPPTPVTLTCSASPASVFPGDPVTVTASGGNLDPKLNVIYSVSGPGLTGSGLTGTVSTGALAAGSYPVNCAVKEGKPGKEGLKPWQSASASASFTVKAFEPPTISCSVSPTIIKPGESSTVTAVGVSPQNRPLTYSYTASAGSIAGNGNTATYSSVGAPTGPVNITCTVTDDKGQSASATISAANSVTITAPYVAPVPHTQALCSISFATDKLRPTRVSNEAKACLDEIALDLQKQSDAKAVVVGSSNAKEKALTAKEETAAKKNKHLAVVDSAAERAVNTKDYLVTEKGIDASRISVATGTTDGQTVEDYLVPSGASFSDDVTGTTPVDETTVKVQARKPLHEAAHKKAAAKNKP